MTSQNDSVIICDSPSPSKSTEWMNTLTNYRKRLRSCRDFKDLLDTVYESPLVHLRRNIVKNNVSNRDSDVTVVSTPPPKRQKIGARAKKRLKSLDRSVVVLNDSIAQPVVEIGLSDAETNDVIEVSEASPAVRPSKARTLRRKSKVLTPNRLRAKRSFERALKRREIERKSLKTSNNTVESLGTNDENHNNGQIMENGSNATGEAEDIEVVWVSDSNKESTSPQQAPANEEQPFVVDTAPTLANLSRLVIPRTKKLKRLEPKGKKHRGHKKDRQERTLGLALSSGSTPACNVHERVPKRSGKLREIVIDGSNVAMGHKHGKSFSEKGLQIVINYFKERGHVVTAFLPQNSRTRDRELLEKLHKSGDVVFTPSRRIGGRAITPYDDRFILEYATKCNGIVVSSDQYRDLWHEKPQWRDTIENRLLAPTFVGDYLMFPEDPLGRTGPKLEEFLRY